MTSPFNRFQIGILTALISSQFLAALPLLGAEPVLLRYKFTNGDKVRYSVQMRDDYLIQVGEAQERPYNSQAAIKSYRVTSVDEQGNATLELTLLEQVRVEALQDGQLIKFDSTQQNQEVPELFLPMQAMVGKPHLQITVRSTGEVSNVTPLQGAKAADEGKELAMDVLDHLPQEPMQIGGRWTEDFHVPVQVNMQGLKKNIRMQRQYELKSVESNVATILLATKSLTPLEAPEEEIQLLLRTPKVEIKLDLDKGKIISRTLTLDNQVTGLERGTGTVSINRLHIETLIQPTQTAVGSSSDVK